MTWRKMRQQEELKYKPCFDELDRQDKVREEWEGMYYCSYCRTANEHKEKCKGTIKSEDNTAGTS